MVGLLLCCCLYLLFAGLLVFRFDWRLCCVNGSCLLVCGVLAIGIRSKPGFSHFGLLFVCCYCSCEFAVICYLF